MRNICERIQKILLIANSNKVYGMFKIKEDRQTGNKTNNMKGYDGNY